MALTGNEDAQGSVSQDQALGVRDGDTEGWGLDSVLSSLSGTVAGFQVKMA